MCAKELDKGLPLVPCGPLPQGGTASALLNPRACWELADRGGDHCAGDGRAECADTVGISRVSARRYLEHYVARGAASVRLQYGGAGRPERRYRTNS